MALGWVVILKAYALHASTDVVRHWKDIAAASAVKWKEQGRHCGIISRLAASGQVLHLSRTPRKVDRNKKKSGNVLGTVHVQNTCTSKGHIKREQKPVMYTMYIHPTLWELRELPLEDRTLLNEEHVAPLWHSLLRSTKINSTCKNVPKSWAAIDSWSDDGKRFVLPPGFWTGQLLTARIHLQHLRRVGSGSQNMGGSVEDAAFGQTQHLLQHSLLEPMVNCCTSFIRRHYWDHSMLCMKTVACFADRCAAEMRRIAFAFVQQVASSSLQSSDCSKGLVIILSFR